MTHCDQKTERLFLAGELSSDEEASVVRHLDACPQCQARLEQAAGNDSEWSATRALLQSSAERSHWTPAVGGDVLSETLPHAPDAGNYRPPAVDLAFLAPTDDPAYLGRVGPYEIAGVIGQGGMGIVLKAFDRSLNRHVAIKVLSPFLSGAAAARQRFAREARAMAALSHEHVAPIYAVDEHRGLPYFAMEYVPGGTLAARLAAEGPLEVIAAVRIAMQTALALAAAHDSGLVHRDIKPANILLDRGVERVRVADFGLARAASEASETASGMLAGTPQYMSPEQIHRDACDARSDLFSLGSVMYAMCTGHAPFRAESVFAVLQRIVHDEPRPVRDANPGVPAWLEAFIERLMAKDRDERFQSAGDVAELLSRELAHLQDPRRHPAPARPWLPRRSAWRRFATQRSRSALAMAAAVVGVTALAWQLVGWVGGPPATQQGPAVGTRQPAGPPYEPSTATMWTADGFEAAAQFANALEADMLDGKTIGAPDPGSLDPWSADVIRLRQGVGMADREALFPETQRIEP
jgi:hypothetical protein